MFIKLNSNNEIIASASFKVNSAFFETNREIVRGYDGKLYFKGEEPAEPIDDLKQNKINQADSNCQNYIYSVYPIHKQMNIINQLFDYTNEDREIMNNFINSQRKKFHNIKEEINNCLTKEELDLINIDFKNE